MAKTINGKIGRVIAHSCPPNVVLFRRSSQDGLVSLCSLAILPPSWQNHGGS
jgi:hypothetical protein